MYSVTAMSHSARQYVRDLPLWNWQEDAWDSWLAAGCRGIVEAVTGAGKTRLAMLAIGHVLVMRGKALVLVPSEELMRQWTRELERAFPRARIRMMSGGRRLSESADVIVAIVNSAARRADDGWFKEWVGYAPSLLVADECHRYAARSFSLALDPSFDLRLGLTATLERSDGREGDYVIPYFESVVFELRYERALRDGVVVPWEVTQVGVELGDRESAKYRRHELERQGALSALEELWGMDRDSSDFFKRMEDIGSSSPNLASRHVRVYRAAFSAQRMVTAMTAEKYDAFGKLLSQLDDDRRALVFTTTKDSAELAAAEATAARLTASVVHSGVAKGARAEALAEFDDGEVQMLFAPRVLDEGIDVPACGKAFILGMSSSPRQLKQRLGRIIRRSPGKSTAMLYYIYARDTHEDPARQGVGAQWGEVLAHAKRVLQIDIGGLKASSRGPVVRSDS